MSWRQSRVCCTSFAVLRGLYWLATNLAGRRPLLIAVDDAHWADEPSLRLLAYLAARVEGRALALLHDLHLIGDVAIEEGTFSETHDGVLHGAGGDIPPTGRSVELGYIQVLRFRAGKHVSLHLMFDRLLMLEQLGLAPVPISPR